MTAQTDLAGRVVDKAGAGTSGAQVWAIGGIWEEPKPAAQATTDAQGRFLMPKAWGQGGPASLHDLSLFARAPDGRIGWLTTLWRPSVEANEVRIELGPIGEAKLEVPLERLPTISGRVLDAQTGKGIAGIGLRSFLITTQGHLQPIGQAQTDAEGRYTIAARPGRIEVQPVAVPKTYLGYWSSESPRLEVTADRNWPDLKLARAMELDGIVVDPDGQPVVGAEVFVLAPDPMGLGTRDVPVRTGPGGTFHLDQLDPDDTMPLLARTRSATTNGAIVIRPREVKGKLTLTIDPKFAFRIRGLVTDRRGKRLEGARVTVSWSRRSLSERPDLRGVVTRSSLEAFTINQAGWFVFRDLWPGQEYRLTVEAKGHSKVEAGNFDGQAGQTFDFGKIALISISGHIAGRVVGTDGRPIVNAFVFNRGDGPLPVEVHTDAQGRFRLDGLYSGVKYAFIRQDGYRFTGVKCDADADDLTIRLLKPNEPSPAWKPGATASYEDQRLREVGPDPALGEVWQGPDAERRGLSHPGHGPARPGAGLPVVGRERTPVRQPGPAGGRRGAGRDRWPGRAEAAGPGRQ